MWFWLFVASFLINIFGLLYVRWLLRIVATINEDMENLNVLISNFTEHTKSIFELEMFYGDETLQSLLDHARELSNRLGELDLVLNEEREEIAEEAPQKD